MAKYFRKLRWIIEMVKKDEFAKIKVTFVKA